MTRPVKWLSKCAASGLSTAIVAACCGSLLSCGTSKPTPPKGYAMAELPSPGDDVNEYRQKYPDARYYDFDHSLIIPVTDPDIGSVEVEANPKTGKFKPKMVLLFRSGVKESAIVDDVSKILGVLATKEVDDVVTGQYTYWWGELALYKPRDDSAVITLCPVLSSKKVIADCERALETLKSFRKTGP
jgi:hypothetical protein